jgi:hypothetical protein
MMLLRIVLRSLILRRYTYWAIIKGRDVNIKVKGLYLKYRKAMAIAIADRKNWKGTIQAKLKIQTFMILILEEREMAAAVSVVFKIKKMYVTRKITQIFLV